MDLAPRAKPVVANNSSTDAVSDCGRKLDHPKPLHTNAHDTAITVASVADNCGFAPSFTTITPFTVVKAWPGLLFTVV